MSNCDGRALVFDDETGQYTCVDPSQVPFTDEWWPVVDDYGILCLGDECGAGSERPHYHHLQSDHKYLT